VVQDFFHQQYHIKHQAFSPFLRVVIALGDTAFRIYPFIDTFSHAGLSHKTFRKLLPEKTHLQTVPGLFKIESFLPNVSNTKV